MITLQKKGYLVTHRHSRLIDVNLTYFDFQYHENYDFKIQMVAWKCDFGAGFEISWTLIPTNLP